MNEEPLGVEYQLLYYRISELFHLPNIGEIGACNAVIQTLLEMIKVPENIHMTPSCKNRLIETLADVSRRKEMHRFNELVIVVSRISIKASGIPDEQQ